MEELEPPPPPPIPSTDAFQNGEEPSTVNTVGNGNAGVSKDASDERRSTTAANLTDSKNSFPDEHSSLLSAKSRTGSLSDVVLQVKPRLNTRSRSTPDASLSNATTGRRTGGGNFSARLRKIRETRKDNDAFADVHSKFHHSAPSSNVSSHQLLSTVSSLNDPLSNIEELQEETPTEYIAAEKSTSLSTSPNTPRKTSGGSDVHLYEVVENLHANDEQQPSKSPMQGGHIYDIPILPKRDQNTQFLLQSPPLPSLPPPSSPPFTDSPSPSSSDPFVNMSSLSPPSSSAGILPHSSPVAVPSVLPHMNTSSPPSSSTSVKSLDATADVRTALISSDDAIDASLLNLNATSPTAPPTAPPTVLSTVPTVLSTAPPTVPSTAPPTVPPTAPPTVPPTVPPIAPPTVHPDTHPDDPSVDPFIPHSSILSEESPEDSLPPPPLPTDGPPPLPVTGPPEEQPVQSGSPNSFPYAAPPLLPPTDMQLPFIKTVSSVNTEDYKCSPSLSPGYVQFSTEEESSGTTLGYTDSNVQLGSNSTLTSISSDREAPLYGGMHRPLSVTSMMLQLHDSPFQSSNLKKWRVTNLAEMDDQVDTRPMSLPSSGRMKRIHSSIEPMLHSLSVSSQMNDGVVNQSLESITERHTPPDTPPYSPDKAPLLIQKRLSSGNMLDKDVIITQVSRKRWSYVSADLQNADLKDENEANDESDETLSIPPSKDDTSVLKAEQQVFGTKVDTQEQKKHAVGVKEDFFPLGRKENNSDLYDTEGEPEGEGNLHKINRDIPKSISSLFNSVVSDIPGLASSEENGKEEEIMEEKEQKLTLAPQDHEANSYRQTAVAKLGQSSNVKMTSDIAQATSRKVEVKKSASAQLLTSSEKGASQSAMETVKESLSYDKIGDRQSQGKGRPNIVHKRSAATKSGSLKPVKIFMQRIHPGLMYKMFLINTSTTAKEVVLQGLEKANIVDDPKCFALYEVYDSSQEAIRVLQEQDCPLSSHGNTSAPTHLELRRCRIHHSKSIEVFTESFSKKKSVTLTISVVTTASEVAILTLKKLQLLKEAESEHLRSKYKLMIVDEKTREEWLVDDHRCVLEELRSGCTVAMVDIQQYLLIGEEEKRFIIQNFPDDPNVMKTLLKECEQQINHLRSELLVKEHMLNQLRTTLENAQRTNQELEAIKDSLSPLEAEYQQLQESSAREIKGLNQSVNLLAKEKEVKEDDIRKLLLEKEQTQIDIQTQDKTIHEISQKLLTMEEDLKTFSSTKAELERIFAEKTREVATLESNLAEKNIVLSERNAKIEEMERSSQEGVLGGWDNGRKVQELVRDKTILQEKIRELEKDSQLLKDNQKNEDGSEGLRAPSLFSVLGSALKQVILSVEAVPSDIGLGVEIANCTEGAGCVVKTVAETSSAAGILQSGDKLLEVNGNIVKGHSHKDIASILQAHSGPVQLVVSRSFTQDRQGVVGSDNSSKVMMEVKLAEQALLNDQWQKENERMKNELESSYAAVAMFQAQVKQKQLEIENLENLSDKQRSDSYIHSLRKQLSATQSTDEHGDFLADTLKNDNKEEILEVLRTVESDCLKHKHSFEQLLELIVTHNPALLDILADDSSNKQEDFDHSGDPDEWC